MLIFIVALTVLLFILYFVIMLVWPEWVGISGADTKKQLEAHKETAKETHDEKTDEQL